MFFIYFCLNAIRRINILRYTKRSIDCQRSQSKGIMTITRLKRHEIVQLGITRRKRNPLQRQMKTGNLESSIVSLVQLYWMPKCVCLLSSTTEVALEMPHDTQHNDDDDQRRLNDDGSLSSNSWAGKANVWMDLRVLWNSIFGWCCWWAVWTVFKVKSPA